MLDEIKVDYELFMFPYIKGSDDGMRTLMGPGEALEAKHELVNQFMRIAVVRQHHQLADVCRLLVRIRPYVQGTRGNYNSFKLYHDCCVELFMRLGQIAHRLVLICLLFKLFNYIEHVVIVLLGIDRFQIGYTVLQISVAHQSYIQVIV